MSEAHILDILQTHPPELKFSVSLDDHELRYYYYGLASSLMLVGRSGKCRGPGTSERSIEVQKAENEDCLTPKVLRTLKHDHPIVDIWEDFLDNIFEVLEEFKVDHTITCIDACRIGYEGPKEKLPTIIWIGVLPKAFERCLPDYERPPCKTYCACADEILRKLTSKLNSASIKPGDIEVEFRESICFDMSTCVAKAKPRVESDGGSGGSDKGKAKGKSKSTGERPSKKAKTGSATPNIAGPSGRPTRKGKSGGATPNTAGPSGAQQPQIPSAVGPFHRPIPSIPVLASYQSMESEIDVRNIKARFSTALGLSLTSQDLEASAGYYLKFSEGGPLYMIATRHGTIPSDHKGVYKLGDKKYPSLPVLVLPPSHKTELFDLIAAKRKDIEKSKRESDASMVIAERALKYVMYTVPPHSTTIPAEEQFGLYAGQNLSKDTLDERHSRFKQNSMVLKKQLSELDGFRIELEDYWTTKVQRMLGTVVYSPARGSNKLLQTVDDYHLDYSLIELLPGRGNNVKCNTIDLCAQWPKRFYNQHNLRSELGSKGIWPDNGLRESMQVLQLKSEVELFGKSKEERKAAKQGVIKAGAVTGITLAVANPVVSIMTMKIQFRPPDLNDIEVVWTDSGPESFLRRVIVEKTPKTKWLPVPSENNSNVFSKQGDSGSPILDDVTGALGGIVICGSGSSPLRNVDWTYGLPANVIHQDLRATFDIENKQIDLSLPQASNDS